MPAISEAGHNWFMQRMETNAGFTFEAMLETAAVSLRTKDSRRLSKKP